MGSGSFSAGGVSKGPKKRLTWYYNKWTALVGGLWVMSAAGLSFNFSIYSSSLKSALSYSQEQIDVIATASNIGNNLGLPAGILSLVVPPWALLFLGGTMNLIGYGALWLVASLQISPLPFWQIFFYQWLAPTGATLLDTAALVVCVHNLPRSRGSVVGLLIGLIGLSGAIYAAFYKATWSPDDASFLAMAAVGPVVACVVVAPMLRSVEGEEGDDTTDEEEDKYINFCFKACFGLALYLTGYIIVEAISPLSKFWSQIVTIGVIVILISPFSIPFNLYVLNKKPPRNITPVIGKGPSLDPKGGGGDKNSSDSEGSDDFTNCLFPNGCRPAFFQLFLKGREKRMSFSIEDGHGSGIPEEKEKNANRFSSDDLSFGMNVIPGIPGMQGLVGIVDMNGNGGEKLEGDEADQENPKRVVGMMYSTHLNGVGAKNGIPISLQQNPNVKLERISQDHVDKLQGPLVKNFVESSIISAETCGQVIDGSTCLQALCTSNFWLLFLSMLFGVGSTATVINNLEAIAEALSYDNAEILVSLISIWNFMGRVLGGFYSDALLKTCGCPRSVIMGACQASMIAGYLLIAFPFPGSLYIALLIIGGGLGATDALVAAATSELFGLRSFGLIYNVVTSAPALGSYLFATLLAGYIYDEEAWIQKYTGVEQCYGSHCFRLTFITMALVSAFGWFVNVLLTRRTREFYLKMSNKHVKELSLTQT